MNPPIADGSIWDIGAFWPVYNDWGDSTLVLWKDGRCTPHPVPVRRVLKDLAAVLAVDLTQLRDICGRETRRKLAVPLAMHERILLVPLRVRRARIAGDEVYGYFHLSCIQGVRVGMDGRTEIAVADRIVPLEQRLRSVEEQLVRARMVQRFYYLRMVCRALPITLGKQAEDSWPAELGEDRRVYPSGDPPVPDEGTRILPFSSSNHSDPSGWITT
ncbi:MAG: hypothetical protein IRY98_12265 [Alicyclobacillaceae bacterium]|nr:hypothetical protein [Alicyclobacillaceae bacterium]